MEMDVFQYYVEICDRLLTGRLVNANILNKGALEKLLFIWRSNANSDRL